MARTRVANISDGIPPNSVYIGRDGRGMDGYFGNPVRAKHGRQHAISGFRSYFNQRMRRDPEFARRVAELKGKVLLCHCKPMDCHGDVYVEWLERGG